MGIYIRMNTKAHGYIKYTIYLVVYLYYIHIPLPLMYIHIYKENNKMQSAVHYNISA